MDEFLKLPVGIDNFEKIRRNGFYYVDKTSLIEQLFSNWGEVNLFTRPRRFGKTLNMSMLKYFFEIGTDRSLFDGLHISSNEKICSEHMGKYPVIFLSLKNAEGLNFDTAKYQMVELIAREAERFPFLAKDTNLSDRDREKYRVLTAFADGHYQMSDDVLYGSLQTFSELLYKHFNQKTVILIDEYDVPLDKAFQHGYYREMVALIRAMFGRAIIDASPAAVGSPALPVGIYRQEIIKVVRKRFRIAVPVRVAYSHLIDEAMIVGGIAIAGEVVHGETVNARRVVEREGDGRGERLPVEEEGPVLSCDEANRRREAACLLRIVHGDRKLPAGVVQTIALEPIALVREVVRNPDLERIHTGIDRVFALDDDIERIYRIAAHVEVGRIVLSQIYVVGQQFAFALRFDPQEGRSFGCVAGTFLLLRGYPRHFAPTVLRQEERARCLAVLIRCDRRKLGRGELTGLLILRKQRGDTCHIHHLHGLELQVVVHPVEGDVADDFGHVAPDGDRMPS